MACGLIYQGMQNSELMDSVFNSQDTLWELAKDTLGYAVPSVSYNPPDSILNRVAVNAGRGSWIIPTKPVKPDFPELDLPRFSPDAISSTVNSPNVPIPTRASPAVAISEPSAPGALSAAAPIQPMLVTPAIEGMSSLPEIAQVVLTNLQVPSIIGLTIPGLPAAPPELTLDIATQNVSYTGSDYTATNALVARITSWLAGGTRMPDAVWSMIVDKAIATSLANARQLSGQAKAAWAARGFEFVGGPLDKQLRDLRYELAAVEQNKIGEILAAQAKEELENLQLAVAQGTALEGQLTEAWHKERMRELAAARATVKLAIDTIDAKIALVNAQTARYVGQAEVYATYVRGLVLEYKRYALGVEAQSINALYNKNATAKYVAEMRALLSYSKKFAAEMQSLRIIADHNKHVATRYRIAVSAGAQAYVAAEEAWRGWLARYELPQLEAERHQLLSTSFAERTQAWRAGIELEGMKAKSNLAKKHARTKEVEQDVARFLEEATAKQTEIDETARTWAAYFGSFDDYYQAWTAAVGVDEANQRAAVIGKTLGFSAKLAAVTEDFDILATQRRLAVEQDGGNAEIKANLGAAMFNVIHVSSNIGARTSASDSTTCRTTYGD